MVENPFEKVSFLKLILIINSVYENYHNCVIIAYFSTYLNFRAKNGKTGMFILMLIFGAKIQNGRGL